LEQFPKDTIALIKNSLTKAGIANPVLQSGILAVVSTEGSFYPKNELNYSGTKNSRLRTLFGSRLADLTETQLETLKKDNVAFYNKIYGGTFGKVNLGNTQPNDGWDFRGRGFNGITGRALYNFIGKQIGVDLVNYPERLNELPVASDALAIYFANGFKSGITSGQLKKKFGIDTVADIKDLPTATKVAFQSNAGWKTDLSNPALQAEHEKQLKNVQLLFDIVTALNPITSVANIVYQATDAFTNPKKKVQEIKFWLRCLLQPLQRGQLYIS
jgi:predicted chitinase